jgi:hypothetical protein
MRARWPPTRPPKTWCCLLIGATKTRIIETGPRLSRCPRDDPDVSWGKVLIREWHPESVHNRFPSAVSSARTHPPHPCNASSFLIDLCCIFDLCIRDKRAHSPSTSLYTSSSFLELIVSFMGCQLYHLVAVASVAHQISRCCILKLCIRDNRAYSPSTSLHTSSSFLELIASFMRCQLYHLVLSLATSVARQMTRCCIQKLRIRSMMTMKFIIYFIIITFLFFY